jgi:DNA-directed RNA polymerase specialized sigma24 family protein
MKVAYSKGPDWMGLALWVARRYKSRADYDDIRQEAMIGAWRSVQKASAPGACREGPAAIRGAQWACAEYVRYKPGGKRYLGLDTVSLEGMMEGGEWEPYCPSGMDEVVNRISLWGEAKKMLTKREYGVLLKLYVFQCSYEDVALGLGCSVGRVSQIAAKARRKMKEAMESYGEGG